MTVTELEGVAKAKKIVPSAFHFHSWRKLRLIRKMTFIKSVYSTFLCTYSDLFTNKLHVYSWCVWNPKYKVARRIEENIVSGPQLYIHILVREGNLNRDHRGRETRSVSIETASYSDPKASPKAAGKCGSLQWNGTRACVSWMLYDRPQCPQEWECLWGEDVLGKAGLWLWVWAVHLIMKRTGFKIQPMAPRARSSKPPWPVGLSPGHHLFLLSHKLKVAFTFLNGWKKSKEK